MSRVARVSPVVLIVGDFDLAAVRGPSQAWDAVSSQIRETCTHDGLLNAVEHLADGATGLAALAAKLADHQNCVAPFPLKIDVSNYLGPGDNRRALEGRLRRLLATFNVIGIIACGTANANSAVVDALGPLDVPVVSTLSGVYGYSSGNQNVPLQLMPHSGMQAREIVSYSHGLLAKLERPVVYLLAGPRGDAYVDSMALEIDRLCKRSGYGIELRRIAEADPSLLSSKKADLLVCVGRGQVTTSAEKIAGRFRYVLLADGCEASLTDVNAKVIRSTPTARPAQYASDAWRAFQVVYRGLYTGTVKLSPSDRLLAMTARVRDVLQRDGYLFEDLCNVRDGFFLQTHQAPGVRNARRRRKKTRTK